MFRNILNTTQVFGLCLLAVGSCSCDDDKPASGDDKKPAMDIYIATPETGAKIRLVNGAEIAVTAGDAAPICLTARADGTVDGADVLNFSTFPMTLSASYPAGAAAGVAADQSSAEKLAAADYATGEITLKALPANGIVSIPLARRLAKIDIRFAETPSPLAAVTVASNGKDGLIPVKAYVKGLKAKVLVEPGDAAVGQTFITVTTEDGKTYSADGIPSTHAGYRYTYTARIAPDGSLTLSAPEITVLESSTPTSDRLVLMTYNVHGCLGTDQVRSTTRISDIVNKMKPAAVGMQELDSVVPRSGNRYYLEELGHETGMLYEFSNSYAGFGGAYGNGLLLRQKALGIQRYPLPGEEPRSFIFAEYPDYCFGTTHFDLTEDAKLESAKIIGEIVQKYNKPFFITGDMNIETGSAPYNEMMKHFRTLNDTRMLTFPANAPTSTIDYIMVHDVPGVTVTTDKTEVYPEPIASDHRPVIVTLSIE